MPNPDMPRREQLTLRESLTTRGWSMVKNAGTLLLAGFEGAIDGAIGSILEEREIQRIQRDDRDQFFTDIEALANSTDAHKKL
jgi:hypothetical protein